MKIKVRTIIKNLATLLLLPLTCFLIILPLLYGYLPFQFWIWGYGDETEFHINRIETLKLQLINLWIPLISIITLALSIILKKENIKNASIISLTIPNAYWLYTFGIEVLQHPWYWYSYSLIDLLLMIYIPLCALTLLGIYCLLWLTQQLKGKITIVNE
jgi:hypothetical protein